VIFTIFTFLIDDFSRFFTHYIFHKVPFLWRFHRVHHSAEVLTPITLHRSHPVESVIMFFRNILTYSISTAIFIYLYRTQLSGYEILGVNALGLSFNFALSNLRHSHVPVKFGALESIFISPYQHQLHHSNSPEHFNKNYGICLSIWDKLFGSLLKSKGQKIKAFGL
jgi:sterol desaturase/sphingolipid hydroxylase (fatty acid hydroxylase superfamily)